MQYFNRRFGVANLGNNALTVGSGGRFSTPAQALAQAVSGQTVFILPGTYVCASLSVPAGVSVVGVDPMTCIIQGDTTTLKDTTSGLFALNGGNEISGLDVSRTDTVGVATPGPMFKLMAAGSFNIYNNRIGNCPDVVNTNGAYLYDFKFHHNDIYTAWWDQITLAQYANGSKFYVCDNLLRGDCANVTLIFYNCIATANYADHVILRNTIQVTPTSATTTDVIMVRIPRSATSNNTYTCKGNRWYVNGSAQNPTITRYEVKRASSAYTANIVISDDEAQFSGSGTTKDITVNTGSVFPTNSGTILIRDSDIVPDVVTWSASNYPTLTQRGSSLMVKAWALTDGATVTLRPNHSHIQSWTCTQNTSLVASGTAVAGQRMILVVADAGAHTLTPDASTVFGATVTTVAGKTVTISYVYNGTAWIQEAAQTTGY